MLYEKARKLKTCIVSSVPPPNRCPHPSRSKERCVMGEACPFRPVYTEIQSSNTVFTWDPLRSFIIQYFSMETVARHDVDTSTATCQYAGCVTQVGTLWKLRNHEQFILFLHNHNYHPIYIVTKLGRVWGDTFFAYRFPSFGIVPYVRESCPS